MSTKRVVTFFLLKIPRRRVLLRVILMLFAIDSMLPGQRVDCQEADNQHSADLYYIETAEKVKYGYESDIESSSFTSESDYSINLAHLKKSSKILPIVLELADKHCCLKLSSKSESYIRQHYVYGF